MSVFEDESEYELQTVRKQDVRATLVKQHLTAKTKNLID